MELRQLRHFVAVVGARVAVQHPHLSMVVMEGYFEELMSELVDGRLDLIFSNFPPVTVPADSKLEPLLTISAPFVASRGHPFAKPVVGSGLLLATLDVLRTNSLNLMIALVCSGQFLCSLPEHLLIEALQTGALHGLQLSGDAIKRSAVLIYNEAIATCRAVQHFRDCVREVCRGMRAVHGSATAMQ